MSEGLEIIIQAVSEGLEQSEPRHGRGWLPVLAWLAVFVALLVFAFWVFVAR